MRDGMTTLRAAAQQALEALETWTPTFKIAIERKEKAITDLRAALAEPVQEPVLVVEKEPDYWSGGHFHEGSRAHIDPTKVWGLPIGTKLYTAPSQRKQLTDEEIQELSQQHKFDSRMEKFVRIIERAHGIGGQDESA